MVETKGEKEMKDKGIAAGGTLAFMALVNTNAMPELWQVAFLAIGLYEVLLLTVRIARALAKEHRRREYRKVCKEDGRRWADTWLRYPMKEVL